MVNIGYDNTLSYTGNVDIPHQSWWANFVVGVTREFVHIAMGNLWCKNVTIVKKRNESIRAKWVRRREVNQK